MAAKRIVLLGATGSIGTSAVEVVTAHPERFRVVALAAGGGRVGELVELVRRLRPEAVAVADPLAAERVREELSHLPVAVLAGSAGVIRAAEWEGADLVLSALVGAAGLMPTIAAIRAGRDVALANKECLVMAGHLFMAEVIRRGVRLLPVDSEHSAIFQVLGSGAPVRRLIITASGGPFLGWSGESLAGVTPRQALAHPRWAMGPKISIDSATLMNKGLEVIEARWLFDVPLTRIEVVIHPQSIVHSLVDYADGSVLAQMGMPDMRTPIAVALAWPERVEVPVAPLDLAALGSLTFATPDRGTFPCLDLAYAAGERGGAAPAVLNAANEVAVAAFLRGEIPFTGIPRLIARTLERVVPSAPASIEEVMAVDEEARAVAREGLGRVSGPG